MRSLCAVLLGAGLAAAGCWTEPSGGRAGTGECGDVGCADLLTLYIVRRDAGRLVQGEYTITIDDGAITAACEIETDGSLRCAEKIDTLSINLNPRGDELILRLEGTPVTLAVDVRLNGKIIGSEVLTPRYELIVPSDPDCPDTCLHGSQTIGVQSPPDSSPTE